MLKDFRIKHCNCLENVLCNIVLNENENEGLLFVDSWKFRYRKQEKYLRDKHVEAGFSTALEEIRSEDAMQIYDFFEAVIEESLEDLLAFNVNLKRREARIIMSMSVECKTDLQEIARRYGAYAEQDFDGSWLLSLILGGGGGK